MSFYGRTLASILLTVCSYEVAWGQSESQRRRFKLLRPGPISRQITASKTINPNTAVSVQFFSKPQVSPDGRWLLFELTSSTLASNKRQRQIFRVSSDGGDVEQLTHHGASNHSPRWSPSGQQIVFVRSDKGTSQIYLLNKQFAEAKPLTQLKNGAYHPIWSADESKILFRSKVPKDCVDGSCQNEGGDPDKPTLQAKVYDELLYRHWNRYSDHRISNLFLLDLESDELPRNISRSKQSIPPTFLNPSLGFDFVGNDQLVFTKNENEASALSTNHNLYLTHLQTNKTQSITANKAWDAYPLVSPDQRYIAYLSHAREGFEADRAVLQIYEISTGKSWPLTEKLDSSLKEIVWWKDSKGLYFVTDHRGYKALGKVSLKSGDAQLIIKDRSVGGLSVDSKNRVYFHASRFDQLPELFRFDASEKELTQLTKVNQKLQQSLILGKYEEVKTGEPQEETHGFLVFPPAYNSFRKYPLIVLVHGGPQGAWANSWGKRWNPQIFAGRGYIVALPNPRGSRGYGQSFTDAVSKNWGNGPYRDVMRFTEETAKRKDVDNAKICAAGASYGGYMINWMSTQTNRFNCLISHAGLFNLESFWGDTEELWFPEWEFGGPPWSHRDNYRKWSPSEQIEKAQTPSLFIHGQRDYRVDLSHSLGMFTALRRRQIPARLLYFPDEGHWIKKPKNFVYWYEQMFVWLEKYLK